MNVARVEEVLARRLPALPSGDRKKLAASYLEGVAAHALERTTGTGPVSSQLGTDRAELIAHVCRSMGRLLTEDEIGALLRITVGNARTVRKTMLAVYDDLLLLALRSAFGGATRDGRGSKGEIKDGYRVKFSSAEKMEIAQTELDRQGFMWELVEVSGSRRILLIDPVFPIDDILPTK